MAYVESHGVNIYYECQGEGPAVVFSHGAGGNGAIWWQQVRHFAEDYTCITYDHRCFGRSYPASEDLFRPECFADDLIAVLDAAGVQKAALVGQSLGGMSCLRAVLGHPERVWAFVSSDSPLGIDHDEMLADIRLFLGRVQDQGIEVAALGPQFKEADPAGAHLYAQIGSFNPFSDRGQPNPVDLIGGGRLFAPEFMLNPHELADVACPLLFVVGSADPIVTPQVTRDLVKRAPGSQYVEISGAGHSPYFEKPQQYNELVGQFLKMANRHR